ncbi:hypothetical protein EHS25_006271 [Saitozyma podzolica]|uniref:TATA box binding protein associated factor (TAF) histone-like fold domain-containing protein n=1 Tax=Saitozyma podzolica TaxID=1890683 RepID=A0A427YRD0_9TREE|nr:hypothetical protein EHS25_006271 [Saitozyma podzolica]
MPAPQLMGIYPADSITEVAHSLSIDPLGQGAADLLAGDVEYRLHLILQEAKKFMVHGKRQTLLPEDVEHAMEALNVEPVLVPPRPLPQPAFAQVTIPTTSGPPQHLYHVPDDEIDFATYLKQPLPPGIASSAGVKWKAHWLAVEGIQPAIPENPTPSSRAGPSRIQPVPTTGPASLRPSAKSHLPQELQLYFTRLTSALIPPSTALPILPGQPTDDGSLPDAERHRLAALASVRSDQAMGGVLVYFVKWLAESISKCLMSATGVLGCLVDGVEALLANESIFLEPYLHQLLPPLLSIVLTVPLGPHPPDPSSRLTPFDLRLRATDVLGKIASQYGSQYAGLVPRLVSTLNSALHSQPFPSPLGASTPPSGRYEGAVLGLAALGPQAVRSSIWGKSGDGLRWVDDLVGRMYPDAKPGRTGLMRAALKALQRLTRPKPAQDGQIQPVSWDEVAETFGPNFAKALEKRPWMANELLRLRREETVNGEETPGGMEVDEE